MPDPRVVTPLPFLPLFVILIAAAGLRAERRVVERLREAGATSAATAIPLDGLRLLARQKLSRLVRGGTVQQAGEGRYYFDTAAWGSHQIHRRQRIRTTFLAMTVLFGLALLAAILLLR